MLDRVLDYLLCLLVRRARAVRDLERLEVRLVGEEDLLNPLDKAERLPQAMCSLASRGNWGGSCPPTGRA